MSLRQMANAILLGTALCGLAIAQHRDIELSDDAGQVGVAPRVAAGEFGESPNPAYRADEPGLESDPAELARHGETPLPGGVLVGFDVATFALGGASRSLFYWDGVGRPDFVELSAPHEFRISDATEAYSTQFDGSVATAGFNFTLTADGAGPDLAGFLHAHLLFDLVDSAGNGVSNPATGVYAFATTFRVAGLADSPLVYWVLAADVDKAVHVAAVNYISRSVGVVPEPSAFALTAGCLLFLTLRTSGTRPVLAA